MNQAIHSVDLLTWLMGPVVEMPAAVATLAHERIEVEDIAMATLRFANGALGVIEATTAAFPGFLKRIEISGSKGTAVIEEEDLKVWEFAKMNARDRRIAARWPIGRNPEAAPPTHPPSISPGMPSNSKTCCRRSSKAAIRRSTAEKVAAASRFLAIYQIRRGLANRFRCLSSGTRDDPNREIDVGQAKIRLFPSNTLSNSFSRSHGPSHPDACSTRLN